MKIKTGAVVLAAGSGRRMHAGMKKQYMALAGKPLLWYALRVFEDSFIDEIVLVVPPGDEAYCEREIVSPCGFKKIVKIVAGGRERYHSVHCGLQALSGDTAYCFIHDGARPFVTQEILERAFACVRETDACVVAVPAKDTVRVADAEGFAVQTPDRRFVWMMQTPQVFSYPLIRTAYERLTAEEASAGRKVQAATEEASAGQNARLTAEEASAGPSARLTAEASSAAAPDRLRITDDAMVAERYMGCKVRLVEGAYSNIKITTPEDIAVAEQYLRQHGNT